jgi:5-methylcytosine-specific restriction endonuclease McrA
MDAGEVFKTCISRIRKSDLRTRLTVIEPDISQAAIDYDRAGSPASLQTIPRHTHVGEVTKEELMSVYSGRMAKTGQPGRTVYDELFISAPLRECPLCGSGKVMTLDHHLPKAEYPSLVVTPTNLVPSCYWCQRSKKESYPLTEAEQTLHPYYDDFTTETWLKAEVHETSPASFVFFADPPANWSLVRQQRVAHHMEAFELAELFTSNAGSELVNIRHRLLGLHGGGGVQQVRLHLLAEAASRRAARLNSWETAMYTAAADSEWFCDGGFALE